jgi:uncharacterized membrane protein
MPGYPVSRFVLSRVPAKTTGIASELEPCDYFQRVKLTKLSVIMIGVAIAIGAAAAAGPMFAPSCTTVEGIGVVTVPTADLSRGSAKFFCYRDPAGNLLRFVLTRGDDGVVRTVFDACRQCYHYHKGFAVSDGFLICRLCGNRYKLDAVREGMASCQPVELEGVEQAGKVQVRVAALEEGRKLF